MTTQPNTNRSERTAASAQSTEFKPGPFVAIVRNHLDSTYMGGLEVELLTATQAGNSNNAPGQLVPVKYLSPFFGITSYDGANKNEGSSNSQRSYGWWGVPPDIGSKVLVIFAEAGDGYWIGCIPEEHTNIMTPDPFVSSTYNDRDNSKKLPVVEYNKKTERAAGRNSTQYIKPANADAIAVLTTQGLLADDIRGVTSSSSRREVPSAVTGFSSPGPADRRPGAPRVNYGENFSQTPVPQNRLGGSSLVFDDGDPSLLRRGPASSGPPVYVNAEAGATGGDPTLPHNELVRLRTRTGHQILLHNTEDLIYIANAKGTTWIELTSNGKIDIFAQDSVSIHTATDLNIKADKNVNIEAGVDINLKAGAKTNVTAPSSVNLDTPDTNMKNLDVNGSAIVSGSTNTGSLQAGSVNGTAAGSPWDDSDGNGGTDNQKLGSFSAASPTAPTAALPSARVPEHEPWAGHENLHDSSYAAATDTFRQSVQRDSGSRPAAQPPEANGAGDGAAAQNAAPSSTPNVVQSPAPASGITTQMQTGLNAVNANLTSANVSNLVASIGQAARTITYATTQALTRAIDAIASPSTLRSLQNLTGPVVSDLVNGASNLLDLRTTLARGLTPSATTAIGPIVTGAAAGPTTSADRTTLASVANGNVPSGSTVRLSDGNTYTATSTATYDAFGNRTDTWTVG